MRAGMPCIRTLHAFTLYYCIWPKADLNYLYIATRHAFYQVLRAFINHFMSTVIFTVHAVYCNRGENRLFTFGTVNSTVYAVYQIRGED